ncbi:MAG: hypothetical protein P4N59_23965, partial [Negativicutes bacterium]|nr:hypothetical protein [Negativicutes bacterium]
MSVKMILQIAWRIFRKNTTSLGLLGVVSWMAMALLQYLPSVLGSLLNLAIIVFLLLFLPFAIFQVLQGRKIGLGTIGAGIKALWGRTLFLAVLMLLFGLIMYFIPVLYRGFTSVYAKVLLVGLTGVVAVAAIMPIGLSLITIIVKDMGVLDAIGYSWNLTKKHWRKACSGTLALLATVGIGLVLIGAVLFVLGVSGHVLFGAGSHSAITAISGILAYGMRGIISVFSLLVVMVFFLL